MGDLFPSFAKLLQRFGPVQSIFLSMGFLVFCLGLKEGLNLNNRAMLFGTALMCTGIAFHYWSRARYSGTLLTLEERYPARLHWGNLFRGALFFAVAVAAAWYAYILD